MPLFWIVHDIDGERVVRIQEGGAPIFARLNALIDGFGGAFVEAYPFDKKLAKRIPKRMIGRTLTAGEAAALLDRTLQGRGLRRGARIRETLRQPVTFNPLFLLCSVERHL